MRFFKKKNGGKKKKKNTIMNYFIIIKFALFFKATQILNVALSELSLYHVMWAHLRIDGHIFTFS